MNDKVRRTLWLKEISGRGIMDSQPPGEITEAEIYELVAAAAATREKAYAPYSGFAVGAALRAANGQIYTGCNVENASYGLTICAERSAVCRAVASGTREFTAIAVVTENAVTPCGACRQVLAEFNPHLLVIVANPAGCWRASRLDELLPQAFGPADLEKERVVHFSAQTAYH